MNDIDAAIEAIEAKRDKLVTAVEGHEDDIATADYLLHQYDKEEGIKDSDASWLPSQIVTWALRLDPIELKEKIENLRPLASQYVNTSRGSNVQNLVGPEKDRSWTGKTGDAFSARWENFQDHLAKGPEHHNLTGYLEKMLADMADLAKNMGNYQSACASAVIGHLHGIRKKYIKAILYDPQEAEMAVGAAINKAGKQEFDGVVENLYKAVYEFQKENIEAAAMLLDLKKGANKDFRLSMSDMAENMSPMERSKYGESKGQTTWDPGEDNDLD